MNVLALDTATRTGWALSASGVVTSGVFDASIRVKATKSEGADHAGRRFALFHRWLHNKLIEDKVDLIVYESVVGGMSAGGKTAMIQKGLEAIVWMTAYEVSPIRNVDEISVCSFAAATIKKWATGSGALTHESKLQVVNEAILEFPDQEFILHTPTKSQPWSADDNQCDALWILDLALAVLPAINVNQASFFFPSDQEKLTPAANRVTLEKWKLKSQQLQASRSSLRLPTAAPKRSRGHR